MATMAQEGHDGGQLGERVAVLEEMVARLIEENRQLRGAGERGAALDPAAPVGRRSMLGRMGAAVVGGAAVAMAGTATPAAATDGQPLLVGEENSGSSTTTLAGATNEPLLAITGVGTDLSSTLLRVHGGNVIGSPVHFTGSSAGATLLVEPTGASTAILAQVGFEGNTNTAGVSGYSAKGPGLIGASTQSPGVKAIHSNASPFSTVPAVLADNQSGGPGLEAQTSGVAVVATGGRASLLLTPRATAGPPATAAHVRGEVATDSTGALYVCTEGGTSGTWRRLTAAWPGFDPGSATGIGGSLNLLASPFRLFDSRPGSTAPLGGGGALAPGSNVDVQVSGTTPTGGAGVPAGAAGVLATITLTATEGAGGFLKAFPAGVAVPGTSVANWFGAGQNIATTTIVRLSAGGALTLRAGSNPTQVLVDVVGFLG